jgi:hypothetical protein
MGKLKKSFWKKLNKHLCTQVLNKILIKFFWKKICERISKKSEKVLDPKIKQKLKGK